MLVSAFLAGVDDEDGGAGPDEVAGVDELHIVYTEFRSMMTQTPQARRIAPLVVEYVDDDTADDTADDEEPSQRSRSDGPGPLYEFEPEADDLLAHLLPKYINTRIYAALLEAAASEQAARRQAMKAATDNATELIEDLTREANQARQGLITQELSEIVGGAEALAAGGSDD